MPYKRNVNLDSIVEWAPSGGGGGGGGIIGSKHPLPCFFLSSGGGNYAMIDEYPTTDDDTYNSTTEIWAKDIFGFQGFGFTDIHAFDSWDETHPALGFVLRARYDNPDGAIQAFIIVDGDEYGAENNPPPAGTFNGAFYEYTFFWNLNPVTTEDWTYEQLNGTAESGNLQYIGYKKDADNVIEAKVSRAYVIAYPTVEVDMVPTSDVLVTWTKGGLEEPYLTYNYENLFWRYADPPDQYWNESGDENDTDKFTKQSQDWNEDPYTIPANSEITTVWWIVNAKKSGSPNMQAGFWIDGVKYFQDLDSPLVNDWGGIGGGYLVENPNSELPWTPDDINGIGLNAITHIGYELTATDGTVYIDDLIVIANTYPNDEPA